MRRAAVAVCAVLCATFALVEYLNFSGFCYSKQRYLSDAQLMASAIQNNLTRHSPGVDSSRRKMYASIEDFYRQNQACCGIHRWNTSPFGSSLFFRLFGHYEVLVSIVYRINDGGGVDNFYGSDTIVDSCGSVLRVFGEPLANGPGV